MTTKEVRNDECNDDDRLGDAGGKRLYVLILSTFLAALGSTGFSVVKDTSDRFYGDDARELKKDLLKEIEKNELESRQRDIGNKDDISRLRATLSGHTEVIIEARILSRANRADIDKIEAKLE